MRRFIFQNCKFYSRIGSIFFFPSWWSWKDVWLGLNCCFDSFCFLQVSNSRLLGNGPAGNPALQPNLQPLCRSFYYVGWSACHEHPIFIWMHLHWSLFKVLCTSYRRLPLFVDLFKLKLSHTLIIMINSNKSSESNKFILNNYIDICNLELFRANVETPGWFALKS